MQTYCAGCNKAFRKKSKSGYCGTCFHANVDGVKTLYGQSRWQSGVARRLHWKARGASLQECDIEHFESQLLCQFCGKEFAGDKCLDHDHATGAYRGALCRQCNSALGHLGDDLELIIQRLTAYRDSQASRV